MAEHLLALALVVGLIGLLLTILAGRARSSRGFATGETVALDNKTLFSKRYRLVGRPDRMVKKGGTFIPEEWSSWT